MPTEEVNDGTLRYVVDTAEVLRCRTVNPLDQSLVRSLLHTESSETRCAAMNNTSTTRVQLEIDVSIDLDQASRHGRKQARGDGRAETAAGGGGDGV